MLTKVTFRLVLDIVSFYRSFKVDVFSLKESSGDVKPDCSKNLDVKIVDTSSAFESLYLPHVKSPVLNIDAVI